MATSRPKIAVLVSGSGRSLRNLLELTQSGGIAAEIETVVASKAGIAALDHAAAFGVRTTVAKVGDVTDVLDASRPDLVVMAGYLRPWPIPDRYVGRTINIHPSLLPWFGGKGFYGHIVHEAVLASGMKVSGCTVHYVSQTYDEGPIILQRTVAVREDDDADALAARVFKEELVALPEAIRLHLSGRLLIEGRRVRVSAG